MQKRNTMQRQLVYNALQALRTHATAEDVYKEVVKTHPQVTLATVYRNLNVLSGEGRVKKISLSNLADRFDFRIDGHYHLFCTECGRFEDAPELSCRELLDLAGEKSGYALLDYDIVFRGRCPHCAVASLK